MKQINLILTILLSFLFATLAISASGKINNNNATNIESPNQCNIISAGTYTIGNDTLDDYSSFTDAVNDLNTNGISGPVVFLVDSGVYNEHIVINSISGASAINTITFKSATNNAADVLLIYSTSIAYSHTIHLNGTRYITIENITIRFISTVSTVNSDGAAIYLSNHAQNNKIINNNIISSVSWKHDACIRSGPSTHYNLIKGNSIYGGHYALFFFSGNSQQYSYHNIIDSNIISNCGEYGIFMDRQFGLVVSRNIIDSVHFNYGIILQSVCGGFKIEKNIINIREYSYIGIYLLNCNSLLTQADTLPAYVSNNFITVKNANSRVYGLCYDASDNINITNNTILIDSSISNSRCLNAGTTSSHYDKGINYHNNVLINLSDGIAAGYSSDAIYDSISNNCYYTTGPTLATYGYNISNLAGLQAATSQDYNSIQYNPIFTSNTDLHTNDSNLCEAGISLAYVTEDIDGDMRPLSPYMGADEGLPFNPSIDLGPDQIICSGNNIILDGSSNLTYPYTYTWINQNTNDTIGNSQFLTVDTTATIILFIENPFGMISSDTINTYLYQSPSISIGSDTTICNNDTVSIDAGSGFATYLWSTDSSHTQQTLLIDNSFLNGTDTVLNIGVLVTDYNGCTATDTIVITFSQYASIDKFEFLSSAKLYPNPTNEFINFEIDDYTVLDNELRILYLLDANGKQIKEQRIESNKTKISLENLADGIYFVKIANKVYKVVKM